MASSPVMVARVVAQFEVFGGCAGGLVGWWGVDVTLVRTTCNIDNIVCLMLNNVVT